MKLLIVDDQTSVVEGLLQGINWKAMGFREIDTAYNAMDAKSSLLKKTADIMLCDIEMPVENGLSLLAWMREKGMKTKCIFLTAHANFDYAREAIHLGGFEYVIQPAPYSEIRSVVYKAIEEVEKKRSQEEITEKGKAFLKQEAIITSHALRQFLLGKAEESEYKKMEDIGGIPIREKPGYMVLIQKIRQNDGEEEWKESLYTFTVSNIVEELFRPHGEMFAYTMLDDNEMVLVFQNEEGEEMPLESMERQLVMLKGAMEEYIHCSVAIYFDGPVLTQEMPFRIEKLEAMKDDNVSLRSGVFQREERQKSPHVFKVPQIRGWAHLLKEGYTEAMEQEAFKLLDSMAEKGSLNAETLRYFYQDFIQMVYFTLERNAEKIHGMFRTSEELELYRNAMKSVDNMKTLIRHVAEYYARDRVSDNKALIVEKVKKYIEDHIEGELHRDEIAEYVHLNPDYLTRVFKKETGYSLKEYIIQQRMEEARLMLRNTALPISFIAAKVGYSNFAHFSYSYKKILGITPQEERS